MVHYVSDLHLESRIWWQKIPEDGVDQFLDELCADLILDDGAMLPNDPILFLGDVCNHMEIGVRFFVKFAMRWSGVVAKGTDITIKPIYVCLGDDECQDWVDAEEAVQHWEAALSVYGITVLRPEPILVVDGYPHPFDMYDQLQEQDHSRVFIIFGSPGYRTFASEEALRTGKGIVYDQDGKQVVWLTTKNEGSEVQHGYSWLQQWKESVRTCQSLGLPMTCVTHINPMEWLSAPLPNNYVHFHGDDHRNRRSVHRNSSIIGDGYTDYREPHAVMRRLDLNSLMQRKLKAIGDDKGGEMSLREITLSQLTDAMLRLGLQGPKRTVKSMLRDSGKLWEAVCGGVTSYFVQDSLGQYWILNGASPMQTGIFYENTLKEALPLVVETIQRPMEALQQVLERISEDVRRIGGDGRIHGLIVDVDFFNHVAIRPESLLRMTTGQNALATMGGAADPTQMTPLMYYRSDEYLHVQEYGSFEALLEHSGSHRMLQNYRRLQLRNGDRQWIDGDVTINDVLAVQLEPDRAQLMPDGGLIVKNGRSDGQNVLSTLMGEYVGPLVSGKVDYVDSIYPISNRFVKLQRAVTLKTLCTWPTGMIASDKPSLTGESVRGERKGTHDWKPEGDFVHLLLWDDWDLKALQRNLGCDERTLSELISKSVGDFLQQVLYHEQPFLLVLHDVGDEESMRLLLRLLLRKLSHYVPQCMAVLQWQMNELDRKERLQNNLQLFEQRTGSAYYDGVEQPSRLVNRIKQLQKVAEPHGVRLPIALLLHQDEDMESMAEIAEQYGVLPWMDDLFLVTDGIERKSVLAGPEGLDLNGQISVCFKDVRDGGGADLNLNDFVGLKEGDLREVHQLRVIDDLTHLTAPIHWRLDKHSRGIGKELHR